MRSVSIFRVIFICAIIFFVTEESKAQINIDSLLGVVNQHDNDSLRIRKLLIYSREYPDSSLFFVNKASQIANSKSYHPAVVELLALAQHFSQLGNNVQSIKYFRESIDLAQQNKDFKHLIQARNEFGYSYTLHGKSDSAIILHLQNLQFADKQSEYAKTYPSTCLFLAFAYRQYGDLKKAQYYFKTSEQKARLFSDSTILHIAIHERGNIYAMMNNTDSALFYQLEAYEIRKRLKNKYYLLVSFNDIAGSYYRIGNNALAAAYFEKSLELTKNEFYDPNLLFTLYGNLGSVYHSLGNFSKAESYYTESLEIAKTNNVKYQLRDAHYHLAYFYFGTKKFELSAEYALSAYAYNDSVYTEENSKTIEELSTKYETEKKEQQIVIQKLEIRKKNLQTTYLLISSSIFLVLLLLTIFAYRQKNKAHRLIKFQNMEIMEKNEELRQQKEEIEAQRDEISYQNQIVTDQNKHITDSINYASKIQKAALPKHAVFETYVSDFFILFKPRDIVSGDFYWAEKIGNQLIVAVADCTGHGVPGAFMSMLGISFLGNIIRKQDIKQTNMVLEELRHEIKTTLSQTTHASDQKDGMDIAFFTINTDTLELHFSGAFNPLYIIRSSGTEPELIELKADRQPVAVYIKEKPFAFQVFQLQKGDVVYSFSDGYADQFGGSGGGKYKTKKFKAFLETISNLPMPEQKKLLDTEFETWRGKLPQTDDVLVVGLKV